MKTKLVLIIGLLSMQPLFAGGLTNVLRGSLNTLPAGSQLAAAIAEAQTKMPFDNAKTKSIDQNAYDAAVARQSGGTVAPAPTPTPSAPALPTRPVQPAPSPTPAPTPAPAIPTRPARPTPGSTYSTNAQQIMGMTEFNNVRTAAGEVRQALSAQGINTAEIDRMLINVVTAANP
jgi:hypothetical protein